MFLIKFNVFFNGGIILCWSVLIFSNVCVCLFNVWLIECNRFWMLFCFCCFIVLRCVLFVLYLLRFCFFWNNGMFILVISVVLLIFCILWSFVDYLILVWLFVCIKWSCVVCIWFCLVYRLMWGLFWIVIVSVLNDLILLKVKRLFFICLKFGICFFYMMDKLCKVNVRFCWVRLILSFVWVSVVWVCFCFNKGDVFVLMCFVMVFNV